MPIFCPAFTDSSAGFGLVKHQVERIKAEQPYLTIDSVADFRELTDIKITAGTTGLFMVGGGVPKNFAQDTVVCAEILGLEAEMHKYAVQITVADVRDGACSSSTLKEACSWGKVDGPRADGVRRGHHGGAADRLRRLSPRLLAGAEAARVHEALRVVAGKASAKQAPPGRDTAGGACIVSGIGGCLRPPIARVRAIRTDWDAIPPVASAASLRRRAWRGRKQSKSFLASPTHGLSQALAVIVPVTASGLSFAA